MKVYVIIVTFNGSKWIVKCLNSLRHSTIPLHVIVVDNNSSDDTLDIIKAKYPEVITLENKINYGFGKANNIGIEYALAEGADYFFLLNQDAWIQPEVIEALISINKQYPEYFILSPIHLNGEGVQLDYKFSNYISPLNCENMVSDLIVQMQPLKVVYEVKFVNAALWLVSKECIEVIGFFDTIFPHYGEDSDYANRVLYHGYKIGVSPKVYGFHDRDQGGFDLDEIQLEKRFIRKKIFNLIILMNINNSVIKNYLSFTVSISKKVLKGLFYLNFRPAIIELKVWISLIAQMNTIITKRNINKVKKIQ